MPAVRDARAQGSHGLGDPSRPAPAPGSSPGAPGQSAYYHAQANMSTQSESVSQEGAVAVATAVRFMGPETPQSLLAKVQAQAQAQAQANSQRPKQQRASSLSVLNVKWESDRKRRQGYFAADDGGEEKSPFRHYNKTAYD